MATIRNYNAWIKAARKAADKTGGLSLPAARKAYKKMAARVGRPLKGTDVKKHPRIFKESLPKSNQKRTGKDAARNKSTSVSSRRTTKKTQAQRVQAAPARARKIKSLREFEDLGDDFGDSFIEYASTAEYKKKG